MKGVGCFAPFIIAYRASYWLWGLSVHFKLQITGGYDHWSITELPGESQTDIWYHKLNGGGQGQKQELVDPWAQSLPGYRARHVCTSQDGRLPMGGQTYRQCLEAPLSRPFRRLNFTLTITQRQSTYTYWKAVQHTLPYWKSIPTSLPSSPSPWWPFSSVCSRPHKPTSLWILDCRSRSWIEGMWTASLTSLRKMIRIVYPKSSDWSSGGRLFDRNDIYRQNLTSSNLLPFAASVAVDTLTSLFPSISLTAASIKQCKEVHLRVWGA